MTHRMIRNLAGLAVAMNTAVCAAQTPCPGNDPPNTFFWANDCNTPTIVVGYAGIEGVSFSFSNGRWTIVVATASTNDNFSVVEIYATTSGVDIESLSVVEGGEAGAATEALISMPEIDIPMAGLYRFNDVRSISRGTGLTQLALTGGISGDLGVSGVNATPGLTAIGDLKTLIVTGLDVAGDVVGDIILAAGQDDLFDEDNSQLKRLTVSGSILGDIKAQSGGINTIVVEELIGGVSSPIEVSSYSYMNQIFGGEIHASITPGALGTSKDLLRYLETTGLNGTSGDFTGLIDAKQIGLGGSNDGLLIHRNLGSSTVPAIIRTEEPLGQSPEDIIVRVGIDFASPTPDPQIDPENFSRFELPQSGLVGRVILNARNVGGAWTPEAKIQVASGGMNPWILDEQRYEIPRGFVGGGLAGLAPFVEYDRDSKGLTSSPLVVRQFPELCDIGNPGGTLDPEECQCQTVNPGSVKLRFYGGVEQAFPQENGAPVAIWSNEDNNGGLSNLEDITHKFSFSFVTEDGRTWLKITRTSGAWDAGSLYRIRHWHDEDVQHGQTNGGLRCQDVTGQPRIPTFDVAISVKDNCKQSLLASFDLNSDGDLCGADLTAWSNNPVDLNGDNTACSQDVARLVQAINLYNSLD